MFFTSAEATKKLKYSTCIFDLSFNNKQTYALAELLRIPMITLATIRSNVRNEYVFSLRPSEEAIARATVDVVQYFLKDNDQVAILVDGKCGVLDHGLRCCPH